MSAAGATVAAIAVAFPVGGNAAFGPVALAACLASACAVRLAAEPSRPVVRTGALVYVAACLAAFLIPSPLGGTIGRLGALIAGPLVATLLLARARAGTLSGWAWRPAGRAVLAAAAVAALAWQWGPARLDVHDALARRYAESTRDAFYAPMVAEVQRRSGGPVRIEIPFTATHYEARWVAPEVTIARGWLRQVDRARNPLFDDGSLTAARYARWLRASGVDWVALPAAPHDPSAAAEVRIIRSRPAFLHPVWRSRHWRLFRVAGSPGLVSGPGRLVRLGGDSFVMRAGRAGRLTVRIRHAPVLAVTAGAACIERSSGGWTVVRAYRRGKVRVAARVRALLRLGRASTCRRRDAR